MKDVIKRFPQVREIISLNARNSGRFIFVSMDLRLSIKRLKDAHEIATSIEREIKKRIPFAERIISHYEPEWKEYKRYAVPLKNREGEISEHFGGAQFLALWDERISDKVILSKEIIENPFPGLEKGKGIRLAKFLVENGIDILYTKEIFEGKGPEYVFSDADVEVRKTDLQTLQDLTGIR
jgi:predicted Fe-Mo cluster-binding NifX family protein